MRIGALDLGGTNIKACLFENGVPIARGETPTLPKQGDYLMRAADLIESLGTFEAVGISTAGQVDPATGVIRYANDNLPGYTGTDVKGYFEARFSVPAGVMNDVYAAALGEGKAGAAKGLTDYLCLTYGTGIGGGVVLDGKLYYGRGKSAGVMLGGLITHAEAVVPGDPFSGTYERCASTTALIARARQVDAAIGNGRQLFGQLHRPEIRAVLEGWMDEVAIGICALTHCYNVPDAVLGGGILEQELAFTGIRQRVEKYLIPCFRGVRLHKAALGNMAGLYGACAAAEAAAQE